MMISIFPIIFQDYNFSRRFYLSGVAIIYPHHAMFLSFSGDPYALVSAEISHVLQHVGHTALVLLERGNKAKLLKVGAQW